MGVLIMSLVGRLVTKSSINFRLFTGKLGFISNKGQLNVARKDLIKATKKGNVKDVKMAKETMEQFQKGVHLSIENLRNFKAKKAGLYG